MHGFFLVNIYHFTRISYFHFLRNQVATSKLEFTKMERNLRRCKLQSFPSSPLNAASVTESFQLGNVNRIFGQSRHDVPRQFYKGSLVKPSFECTFFASESIIEIIKTSIPKGKRQYFLDATFKIVPFGSFKQILILYVEYIGKVLVSWVFTEIDLIKKVFGFLTGLPIYICPDEQKD
jgi:hypothetical protein